MAGKSYEKSDKKSEKLRFQEGEQVLCFHGPLIYEAKCIKTKIDGSKIEYFIHYSGWNKSWDEWVAEDRLLKFNEENIQKKEELDKNQKQQKKTSKRRTSVGSGGEKEENNSRSNSPKPPLFGRKSSLFPSTPLNSSKVDKQSDLSSARKKKDLPVSPEFEYHEYITITLNLPENLQNLLLYDVDLVCKRKRVTKLPARVTVNDITDKYIQHKTRSINEFSAFKETALALKEYFNVLLSKKILYAFEKLQYTKFMESKSNITPSSVYGVVHLVRLFVKAGHFFAHIPLDDYGTSLVEENINDYIRYVNSNISEFINIDDYQNTTSDYQRKARS